MNITCTHCGIEVPRLRTDQFRCPPCDAKVAAIIKHDEARRVGRGFRRAKVLA